MSKLSLQWRPWASAWSLRLPYVVLVVVLAAHSVFPDAVAWYFPILQSLGAVSAVAAARGAENGRAARPYWFLLSGILVLFASGAAMGASGYTEHPSAMEQVNPHLFLAGLMLRAVFALLLLTALLTLGAHPTPRPFRRRRDLDTLTVVGAGIMALWYFVLGPAMTGNPVDDALAGPVFAVLSLGDLLLITGVARVLLQGVPPTRCRPGLALGTAGVAFTIADVCLTHALIHQELAFPQRLSTALLMLPQVLLVVAATEQRRAHRGGPWVDEDPAGELRPATWLPYGALALGFGLLGLAAIRQGLFPWVGLVIGCVVMTAAVAARQFLVIKDNHDLASTDALTGLANRVRLRHLLGTATELSRRSGRPSAVLLIDLDDFKPVNDLFGHETGDALLVAFAGILRSSVRREDLSARLGGDEFAVVLPTVGSAQDAVGVARRIQDALRTPVFINGHEVRIRASIGIAVSAPGAGIKGLIHAADLAMYEAKREKTQGWKLFAPEMGDPRMQHALVRSELEAAITGDELEVHYQPIVSLTTARVIGVEALVRWRHPEQGLLLPADFLPLVENSGLIGTIDAWVLARAAGQVRTWQHALPDDRGLHLNVNVSRASLRRPDLVAEIVDALARAQFDPHDLVMEVTEAALHGVDLAPAHLEQLRGHGIRVALDDFGTGYSSLAGLIRVPVDMLKLDRCFVSGSPGSEPPATAGAVAQAVAGLGRLLQVDTVAEGIETIDQVERMTGFGYGSGQGHHFARPLAAADLEPLLGLGTHEEAGDAVREPQL